MSSLHLALSFSFSISTFVIRPSFHANLTQFLWNSQLTAKKAFLFSISYAKFFSALLLCFATREEVFHFCGILCWKGKYWNTAGKYLTWHKAWSRDRDEKEKSFLITPKYFGLFSRRRKSFSLSLSEGLKQLPRHFLLLSCWARRRCFYVIIIILLLLLKGT